MPLVKNQIALVSPWTIRCQLVTMETNGQHQLVTFVCNLKHSQVESNVKICFLLFQQAVSKDGFLIRMYVESGGEIIPYKFLFLGIRSKRQIARMATTKV